MRSFFDKYGDILERVIDEKLNLVVVLRYQETIYTYKIKDQETIDGIKILTLRPRDCEQFPDWESEIKRIGFIDHPDVEYVKNCLFDWFAKQIVEAMGPIEKFDWTRLNNNYGFAICSGLRNPCV